MRKQLIAAMLPTAVLLLAGLLAAQGPTTGNPRR